MNGGRSARGGRTVRASCRLSRGLLVKDGRSAPGADCPALLAGLSAIPAGCCTSIDFLFLWPFVFPQRPLVFISFAVAGTVDVCH